MYSPGRILKKHLENEGLAEHFSVFVFSDEAGASKPNAKTYQLVLDGTNSLPENSYHIGDMPQTDIKGARAMGMKSVLFTEINDYSAEDHGADYVCGSWAEVAALLV